MAKVRKVIYPTEYRSGPQFLYMCPGCKYEHAFGLERHQFNGDLDNPTVSPSLLCNWNKERVCHSFIRGGMIEFLNDCWHELKGQTVPLQDYPPEQKLLIDNTVHFTW